MVTIPREGEEQTNELRSGIISSFNKNVNEALSLLPSIRYWITNRVKPALVVGVLKGSYGTPGLVAAIAAKKDGDGTPRLATDGGATLLRGRTMIGGSNINVANSTQTIYIPPLKKIAYIAGLYLSNVNTAAVAGAYSRMFVFYADSTDRNLLLKLGVGTNADTNAITFPVPIAIRRGDVIKLQSSATTIETAGGVYGWVEDA